MMKCPKCGGTFYKFDALNTITAHVHTPLGWEMLPGAYFQQDGYLCDTCGYIEFYGREPKIVLQYNQRFFRNTEIAEEPQQGQNRDGQRPKAEKMRRSGGRGFGHQAFAKKQKSKASQSRRTVKAKSV